MDDWIDVREQATVIKENTENCRIILNNTYSIIYLKGNKNHEYGEAAMKIYFRFKCLV